jgi:energy-coupling factor transport system substrate-specific component
MSRAAVPAAAALAFTGAVWAAFSPDRAGLALLLAAFSLLVLCAAWVELGPTSARELALVATLAAVGAAGRVLFAPVPGVQPLTVTAVAAGSALGVRAGAAVGAVGAFVSNLFLGQGTWTPWQMLGWAACGAAGGLLGPLLRNRVAFAAACGMLGLAFSTLMDLWLWWSFWPHTGAALVTVLSAGIWFSVAHAVGNVVIALAAGPELQRLLHRYGRRLRVVVAHA